MFGTSILLPCAAEKSRASGPKTAGFSTKRADERGTIAEQEIAPRAGAFNDKSQWLQKTKIPFQWAGPSSDSQETGGRQHPALDESRWLKPFGLRASGTSTPSRSGP